MFVDGRRIEFLQRDVALLPRLQRPSQPRMLCEGRVLHVGDRCALGGDEGSIALDRARGRGTRRALVPILNQ